MSETVLVFVSRRQAPAEALLRAALTEEDRLHLEVDVPPHDVIGFEPGELAYVESIVGSFRLDILTYYGDTQLRVADLLEAWYSRSTALADADSDGIYPIPELVLLMRLSPQKPFHAWADPEKRPDGD